MPPVTRSTTRAAGLPVELGTVIDFKTAPKDLPPIGDLQVSIHPIFRRANFDADLNYDLLRPALQLASKFISTPSLLPFWYTSFFSDVRPAKFIIHAALPDPSFEYADCPSILTDEQVLRTQRALLRMRHKVRFHFQAGECGAHENVWGFADPCEDGNAGIYLMPKAVEELAAAARWGERNDWAIFKYQSLVPALILVHELAHAVRFTARGDGFFYFPDSCVSEDGWNWEAYMFGGTIRVVYVDEETGGTTGLTQITAPTYVATYLNPFPSPRSVTSCALNSSYIGLRLTDMPPPICRERLDGRDPLERFVMFDPNFCIDLWEEKFWRTEVSRRGVDALKPIPGVEQRSWATIAMDEHRKMLQCYRRKLDLLRTQAISAAELDELEKMSVPLQELFDIWADVV